MPADPNQTDRIIRHVATHPGNFFVGMGRSKLRVILNEGGAGIWGRLSVSTGSRGPVEKGDQGALLTCGQVLPHVLRAHDELAAKHGLQFSVLNFASIRPLDTQAILSAAETGLIVTVEDHHVDTGLGAIAARVLADAGVPCRLVRLGVKRYGLSGQPDVLYRIEGINAEGIVRSVLEALSGDRQEK